MKRLVVEWAGPQIQGLAVSVFVFRDTATGVTAAVRAAFQGISDILPSGVTITVPSGGDVLDQNSGQLLDVWDDGATPAVVTGLDTANAAAGVGGCITWLTDGIVNGRRVRGRTFIVPLSTRMYQTDGTLIPDGISRLNGFGDAMIAAGVGVWHRPTAGAPTSGSHFDALGRRVRDKVAFLSSRRD